MASLPRWTCTLFPVLTGRASCIIRPSTSCLAIWVCYLCCVQILFKDLLIHFIELSHKCNFPMEHNDRCFPLIGYSRCQNVVPWLSSYYAKFCRTFLYSSTGVLIQLPPHRGYDEICIFEMFCKMSRKITNSGSDSNIPTYNNANGSRQGSSSTSLVLITMQFSKG